MVLSEIDFNINCCFVVLLFCKSFINLAKIIIMKFYFGLILFFSLSFGQTKISENYFILPLDIPMQLSGNFGELRPNHFHAGFDFKTNQRE